MIKQQIAHFLCTHNCMHDVCSSQVHFLLRRNHFHMLLIAEKNEKAHRLLSIKAYLEQLAIQVDG